MYSSELPVSTLVIQPYVNGVTERITRILNKHKVATAVKPIQKIRNLLVHPKDKVEMSEKCEVVYKIPCGSCEKVYIRETGRKLGIRIKEHQKDVEQHGKLNFTRAAKRESAKEFNKSAITDHVNKENHKIDWKGVTVLDRESDGRTRAIKEAVHIRMQSQTMNRDEGAHQVARVYEPVLAAGGDGSRKP